MTVGLHRKSDNLPGGMFADVIIDYSLDLHRNFNYSVAWADGDPMAFTGIRINNTYTGLLLQLYRNESDISAFPLPYCVEKGACQFGEVSAGMPTVMLSLLTVKEYPDLILNQLFRFTTEVVITLLLAIYLFGRILNRSEGKVSRRPTARSILECMWKMVEMLLNQTQVSPVSLAGRILTLMTAIGVMFWMQIWLNEMKTEMVAYDTSEVVETLDDAIRLNKTGYFELTLPSIPTLVDYARRHSDTKIGYICKQGLIHNANAKEADGSRIQGQVSIDLERFRSYVMFGSKVFMEQVKAMYCMSLGGGEILSVPIDVIEMLFGPWYSIHISKQLKKKLDELYVMLRENGFVAAALQKLQRKSNEMSKSLTGGDDSPNPGNCYYTSLKKKIEEISSGRTKGPIGIKQMSDVFELLFFATISSFAVLWIERSGYIEAVSQKYEVAKHNIQHRRIKPAGFVSKIKQPKIQRKTGVSITTLHSNEPIASTSQVVDIQT